jgi:hypothetical protein
MTCRGTRANGEPCKANALDAAGFCLWHSPDPAHRKRHADAARKGGLTKAYGAIPSVAPLAETVNVEALDLETPAGGRALLGAALRQLAALPFDVRVANALAQTVTAQRSLIETADLVTRLDALERAARDPFPLRRTGT